MFRYRVTLCGIVPISIHAPHAGCDESSRISAGNTYQFQSTHPVRGATLRDDRLRDRLRISIHAPRAGCDYRQSKTMIMTIISIHAPHAGCDRVTIKCSRCGKISIHAPHAGCDGKPSLLVFDNCVFQSTHPMRGATSLLSRFNCLDIFQSTHPMRGATHRIRHKAVYGAHISIHAPHAGCDQFTILQSADFCDFNPRTPCGVRQRDKPCT